MRQYSESTLMGMTKKELVQEVLKDLTGVFSYCPNCGAKMDEGAEENG